MADDDVLTWRGVVERDPAHPSAWRELAVALRRAGYPIESAQCHIHHVSCAARDPALLAAGQAMASGRLEEAASALTRRIAETPEDLAALRMLAELRTRQARFAEVEALLARCLQLAPDFAPARHNLAVVLHRQMRPVEALVEVEALIASEPEELTYQNLCAAVLAQLGRYDDALACYDHVLDRAPDQSRIWMSRGHLLKTIGRTADCIAAYRAALAVEPGLGEAWWSLANLKTFAFSEDDRTAMERVLARGDLGHDHRLHLAFALGKANEDAGEFARSFAFYAQGNALRRRSLPYAAAATTEHVAATITRFDADTVTRLSAKSDAEGRQSDSVPIFVLGLPRSGSTLVEQILASHSQVEGTIELPDIGHIARDLSIAATSNGARYPASIADLTATQRRDLRRRYLDGTRVHRRSGRPMFVDKMPNNWLHLGLIFAIFPDAVVIDTRRHPLGCGFSCFKQHFARGQGFSYDLADIGRYYRDYLALTAHFDAVAPGRIHRVGYEAMVAAPEREIRALLGAANLEFEPACLQFHRTNRAVRTASAQQVRQPIYTDAAEHWRHFEPWLDPLKLALAAHD